MGTICLALVVSLAPLSSLESHDSPDRAGLEGRIAGRSYLVGGWWFQFAGVDCDGAGLWLFPHIDGALELFRADDSGAWRGALESVFHPARGEFDSLFSAVEALNEFLELPRRSPDRARIARSLRLFLELHGGEPPYYLRSFADKIGRALDASDLDAVQHELERYRLAVRRVETPGTRVRLPRSESDDVRAGSPESYYRRLIRDGYLDIAITGGNSFDDVRNVYHSARTLNELKLTLAPLGFADVAFRRPRGKILDSDFVMSTMLTRIMDRDIRVRMTYVGGSSRHAIIRRTVANFVEGLAHADIVVYHGHSNRSSGSYYLSETKSAFSQFRMGLKGQQDLAKKCHGLREKPYQILALQSCFSYDRYCRPVGGYLEERLSSVTTANSLPPGFLGTPDRAYFTEFVPRFSTFFRMLFEGAAPRDIAERLNALQPHERSAPMVLRGILQPRFSFIVPDGVEIDDIRELPVKHSNLVVGKGSDSELYFSTEVFPQNGPGEIVQVVAFDSHLYGLARDGRLYVVRSGVGGAMVETTVSRDGQRFSYIARVQYGEHGERLFLIDTDGRVLAGGRRHGRAVTAHFPAEDGTRFEIVGAARRESDSRSRPVLAARDALGRLYTWSAAKRRFVRFEGELRFTSLAPSLEGRGVAGKLWTP